MALRPSPFAIRNMLGYQGESNGGDADSYFFNRPGRLRKPLQQRREQIG